MKFRLLVPLLCVAASPAVQEPLSLFTEEEATELRVPGDEWDPVPRARSASLGPVIVVRTPEIRRTEGNDTIEVKSPTTLEVSFEVNESPVDMASLDITAKKGPFSKSLTERLKPYLHGTELRVESMDVPSGKFQIRIAIRDLEGEETAETYRLVVAGN